jgi:hypothetical protein
MINSILLHDDIEETTKEAAAAVNVKFSKVLIVNDSTTAYIIKDILLPGSTKNVIDRYYSN